MFDTVGKIMDSQVEASDSDILMEADMEHRAEDLSDLRLRGAMDCTVEQDTEVS